MERHLPVAHPAEPLFLRPFILVIGLLYSHSAFAQDNHGNVIIARDVPVRNAFVPGEPGVTTEARTSPDMSLFMESLKDPVPLSDERAAAIQGSRPDRLLGAFGTDFINPAQPLERQQSQAHVSGGHGSLAGTINNAIGNGTSAIQQSVSAIGTALSAAGGRP